MKMHKHGILSFINLFCLAWWHGSVYLYNVLLPLVVTYGNIFIVYMDVMNHVDR